MGYWSPGSGYSEAQSSLAEEAEEEASQVKEVEVVHHPFLVMVVEGEASPDHMVVVGVVEAFQAVEGVAVEEVHPALQVVVVVEEVEVGEERHTEASEWMLCWCPVCLHPPDPDRSAQPCPPSAQAHLFHDGLRSSSP